MRAGGGAWSSTCPHSNSGLRDAQGDTARPNACSSFILLKGFGAEWSLCPESRNPVLPPSVQEPRGQGWSPERVRTPAGAGWKSDPDRGAGYGPMEEDSTFQVQGQLGQRHGGGVAVSRAGGVVEATGTWLGASASYSSGRRPTWAHWWPETDTRRKHTGACLTLQEGRLFPSQLTCSLDFSPTACLDNSPAPL